MAEPQFSKEEARRQFDAFDADGNGVLDAKELFQLAGGLGVLLTDEEVAGALKAIDTDGNGTIEFEEFFAWLSNPANYADKKGALTVAGLRASLMAASALRFMSNLSDQKQDVNMSITIGDIKKAEVYAQYQAMRGHVISEEELKQVPEGGFYGCYDFGHPAGDTLLKDIFDILIQLLPADKPQLPKFIFKQVKDDVCRIIFISPRELANDRGFQKVNDIISLVESKMGEASVRGEYGFSMAELTNNLQFGIKDMASIGYHMKGSVPYGLPHFIAGMMGVPCAPDPPVAPEGKQEPIFDLEMNISKNLVHMALSALPPVARMPFRELFDNFIVSRFIFEEGEGYSKKRKRNELARVLVMLKIMTASASRYITEFQSVHFRTKNGFGVSCEFGGCHLGLIADLLQSIDIDRLTATGMQL